MVVDPSVLVCLGGVGPSPADSDAAGCACTRHSHWVLPHINPLSPPNSVGVGCCLSHFTDEETEAGGSEATCPGSWAGLPLSSLVQGSYWRPRGSWGTEPDKPCPKGPGTANRLPAWNGVMCRHQETPGSQALGHMPCASSTWVVGRGRGTGWQGLEPAGPAFSARPPGPTLGWDCRQVCPGHPGRADPGGPTLHSKAPTLGDVVKKPGPSLHDFGFANCGIGGGAHLLPSSPRCF